LPIIIIAQAIVLNNLLSAGGSSPVVLPMDLNNLPEIAAKTSQANAAFSQDVMTTCWPFFLS